MGRVEAEEGVDDEGTVPRFAKLDFAHLNEIADSLGWLNRVNIFFCVSEQQRKIRWG